MRRFFQVMLFIVTATFVFSNCENDSEDNPGPDPNPKTPDQSLFELVKDKNFAYYKGENKVLPAAGGSPHGSFKLRFNDKALAALDATGKLPAGATFPDSSIVLKEVYTGNTLTLLVPMMRARSNANSGGGWIWGEYSPDGSVIYSVTSKGGACVSCHSNSPNRDLVRSFDLH